MTFQQLTYPAFPRSKFSDWYETTNYDQVEWDDWHLPGYDEPLSICGDCGCPYEDKPFDRGKYEGDNEPLL